MPRPTASDVHAVNVPLTNISIAFAAEEPSVAERVFKKISVRKQSDRYYIYDRADWNRVQVGTRAPGTESEGAGYALSTDSYFCDPYALHRDIAYEEYGNADAALNLDREAVQFLTRNMRLKKDKTWATEFFTTGVWTGSTTGSDIVPSVKWDASNATPIEDMREQARAIHTATGFKPNKLVLGATAWDALQDSAQFLDRIKYTQKGMVTKELLASVLELEEVIVAEVMEATSAPGAAVTTTQQMFGERALLCYVPRNPGLMTPAAGYTFGWEVDGIPDTRVRKFPMDHLNSERVEIQSFFDHKVVSALLGCLFDNVLT